MPDQSSSVAPSHDKSRQDATSKDAFTLTIEEAAVRYDHAGHPRTIRSIQRYCAQRHLDCLRQQTTFGDKFMITPESVARHIAQIEELASATGRGKTRLDAATVAAVNQTNRTDDSGATTADTPRQGASGRATSQDEIEQGREAASPNNEVKNSYLHQLERENVFLRDQIDRKDKTIDALIERDRETNFLVRGLQEMLTPLLGSPRRESPPDRPNA